MNISQELLTEDQKASLAWCEQKALRDLRDTRDIADRINVLQYKKKTLLQINNYIKLNLEISPKSEITIVKAMLTMEEDTSNLIGLKNFNDDKEYMAHLPPPFPDEGGVYWIDGGADTLINLKLEELNEEELLKIELVME